MSTATTTEPTTGPHTTSRPTTQPTNTPLSRSEHYAANRFRTTTPSTASCSSLPLRATRSKGYASGPTVGVCQRTTRGCVRGR